MKNLPRKVFKGGLDIVSLPLESTESVNHNVKRLRFKLTHEDAISGLPLTSALLTMSWPKGGWIPVVRPYTPISKSDEPGFLELLVKKYPGGKASNHLSSLKPGETLLFATMLKGYAWKVNALPHVTFIAGGVGITPIFQLTQGILENPQEKTAITLIYGASTEEDLLLRYELEQLGQLFPSRFKIIYTLSHPSERSPFRKGYITKGLLEETLPAVEENTKVFICGPPAMEASLLGGGASMGILEELGYKKNQVHRF